MKYDPLTRLLHVLVAGGVTTQLLVSLVMVTPRPGRLPNQWYEIHETVGLGLLAVVSVYWLWICVRTLWRGEAMMLFPWLSRRRLADLRADIVATGQELAHLRLPGGETCRPLPGAVQGLGLLLALALAASGGLIAAGMAPDGALPLWLRAVKEIHETLGTLMWVYLAVHPLLGVLHQLAGHRSLSRMFGLRGS